VTPLIVDALVRRMAKSTGVSRMNDLTIQPFNEISGGK
jgi:hypothetical protein